MKTFFFFGDSLTLGVNDPEGNGWVGRFAIKACKKGLTIPPATFYNLGARKHPSTKIASRWEQEFAARALPEGENYLVFCFGTVDMTTPSGSVVVPPAQSVDQARLILTRAMNYGDVLMISPPPVSNEGHTSRIAELNRAYAGLCKELNIPYLDIFDALNTSTNYKGDLADGLHPAAAGSEVFADMLMTSETIKSWLS